MEEIQYLQDIKAWTIVDVRECLEVTGLPPISVRWVDKNKGDSSQPHWRSRLVARQFKDQNDETLFAPMPPLEAKKTLLFLVGTE